MGFIKKVFSLMTKNRKLTALSVTVVAAVVVVAGAGVALLKPATGFSQTITVSRVSSSCLPYTAETSTGHTLYTYRKMQATNQAVYCLNPLLEDPQNQVETLSGVANNYVNTVIANGYPTHSITGDGGKDYYITQLAVWIANGNLYVPGINVPGEPHNTQEVKQGGLPSYMWNDALTLVKNAINNPISENYNIASTNANSKFTLVNGQYETPVITPQPQNLTGGYLTMFFNKNIPGLHIINATTGATITGGFKYTQPIRVVIPKSSMPAGGINLKWSLETHNTTIARTGVFTPAQQDRYQDIGWYWNYPVGTCYSGGTISYEQKLSSVAVNKVTEGGKPLAGATFGLYDSNGHLISEQQTNGTISPGNQEAFWGNLPYGKYTVKELYAPKGYELNPNTFTANVDSKTGVTLTVKDKQDDGGLIVYKMNKAETSYLSGAKFGLYKDGKLVSTQTTDQYGSVYWPSLPTGKYTIKELQAPVGYKLSTASQTTVIKPQQDSYVTFTDSRLQGGIEIVKESAKGDQPLSGAHFSVSNSKGTIIGNFVTGIDGTVNTPVLPFGKYTITETQAPYGYNLSGSAQTVDINSSKTFTVTFKDTKIIPKQGSIEIFKESAKGNTPLSNAVFNVTNSAGQVVATLTTDANGVAQTGNLPYGKYTITETKAPAGYTLSGKPQTVDISNNIVYNVTFKDTKVIPKEGSIYIHKYNAANNQPLAGAHFSITNSAGSVVGTIITDSQGNGEVSNLPYGTYKITETQAPKNFVKDTDIPNVTINSNKAYHVNVADSVFKGTVTALKYSESTHKLLPGCTFGLYYENGTLFGKAITSSDALSFGKATWHDVPAGKYYVKELAAPNGYQLSDKQIPVNVTEGSNSDMVGVKMEDASIPGSVHFYKVDKRTGDKLAGAKFGIWQGDKLLGTTITNADGEGTFSNLKFGKYEIKEMKAPKGYGISTQVWNFEINANDENSLQPFTFDDVEITTSLGVIKVNAQNGDKLKGAEFGLFENGKEIQTATTDSKGALTFKPVDFGKYVVKELVAPTGFLLSNQVWDVNISAVNAGEQLTYTFKDKEITGLVKITKEDYTNNHPVAGAKIKVTCDNGFDKGKVWEWTSNGHGHELELPYGTYTYHEVAAPKGYQVNTAVGHFSINKAGQAEKKLVIKDKRISDNVSISKVDYTTSKPVAGAHVKVICNSGFDKGETWTWVSNGKAHDMVLPYGTYTYEETAAPVGYQINKAVGHFEVTKEGVDVKCVIKDKRITGKIVITKENIANGKVLEGATFIITNQEGKVVAKGTTGTNGETSFTLPYGTYYYSEYKAPDGFGLIQGKTLFEITKEGEVIKAVVKDARLPKTGSVPLDTKVVAGLAGLVVILGGVAIALEVKRNRR